ncbi:MAG: hypothetical protein IIB60_01870 [Planctomycetes bacterium]|nr:hypothetical protein [Planctomycetota bacterium]
MPEELRLEESGDQDPAQISERTIPWLDEPITVGGECLSNHSFEVGSFSSWVVQDLATPFFTLHVGGSGESPGFGFFSSQPTDGSLAALHGWDGAGPGMIVIAQDVMLPRGAQAILFDYRAAWRLTFGAVLDRTFEVVIRPFGGGPPLEAPQLFLVAQAPTTVFDTGDLVGEVDVSAFAGEDVRISFEWWVPENFTGPAFFQLDHIRCEVNEVEEVPLDIKPGSCPNPVNSRSRGVVPMAIVGDDSFDVTQIDVGTLTLRRADGVGGVVAPLSGPPGPGVTIEDTATLFAGELCDCHTLGGDGMDDLSLKFSTRELVEVLELDSLWAGVSVTLSVNGLLLDGTAFEASDCVVLTGGRTPASLRGARRGK